MRVCNHLGLSLTEDHETIQPITSFYLIYSFGPDSFVNGRTPNGYIQFQAVRRRLAFPAIGRTARSMHISFAPVSLLYAFAPHSGLSALASCGDTFRAAACFPTHFLLFRRDSANPAAVGRTSKGEIRPL